MRVFWALLKVIIGLAVAIPVGILVLAMTAGVVGTLVRFAMLGLRLACVGLVGYGVFRGASYLFAPAAKPKVPPVRDLPPADPYYDAAMRELDSELRGPARS